MGDINQNINYSGTGLNTDSVNNQYKTGQLSYALNANISDFSGNSITYQNDEGSIFCFIPPIGYKVVGVKNITQLNQVLYLLVNPSTGHSIIGYTINNQCIFNILLDDTITGSDLLGFDINHPVLKFEIKTTNCSTQIYWTDKFNPRRYLDLNNLPWKDSIIGGIVTPLVGQIDSNKLLVQPNFSVPRITVSSIDIGGTIVEGDIQFAIQYANQDGDGLTGFYSVTNPVRIFLDHHISPNFNEVTNKSITINIDKLDTSGLYSYFNLAVIKTINGSVASVDFVNTFSIQRETFTFTYTGEEQSGNNKKFSITDIMELFDYYDLAGDLTQVDNVLAWADLIKEADINYQKIWNQVNVGWETWQLPTLPSEGYFNGANCANIEGYFRDEVYPLEGCFILANGKRTQRCHIPGRIATSFDLELISISNKDLEIATINICDVPVAQPRWKVYNTGSASGYSPSFEPGNICYKGPYQFGKMAYTESIYTYPNKPEVWGPLANQSIRHHRFPDSTITHIHDQNPFPRGTDAYINYQHMLYPIGFKVDIISLYNAVQSSTDLTDAEKRQIVGFQIMRGDRNNNESIIAKGLFYNCGIYTKEGTSYFYPNYPFNDVNPDPFISSTFVENKKVITFPSTGTDPNHFLNNFQRNRFTFHSPDTHFNQPSGIQGSFVKMDTVEYGTCKAHFKQVLENAGEKLRTKEDLEIALAAGVASVIGFKMDFNIGDVFGIDTGIAFNAQNFFPTFQATLDIIDKLIPYTNYGYQYNGIGYYGNHEIVANDFGNKQRYIPYGGYITPGLNGTFGDVDPATNAVSINNTNRESSVYISIGSNSTLPFPFENNSTPPDNSRATAHMAGVVAGSSQPFFRQVSSYYGAIKRFLPGQYGEIFSYDVVDTGTYSTFFDDNGKQITELSTIFGGDCFINPFSLKIKHPFFLKSTVNKTDGTDIDYDQDQKSNTETGNFGYPIWYYSTNNNVFSVDNTAINHAVDQFMFYFPKWYNILLGGIPTIASAINVLVQLINDGLLISLGIKITNLEYYDGSGLFERGQSYLYAYGVNRFFVESQVNVDMRQAYNQKEGNFYPNVGTDIPDDWLQETNVPISYDNTYTYNKSFSKENKETTFTLLRADWESNQTCYINFNNRVIWSDKSDLEETKNNWLVYRPANMKDLPKNYGSVQAINYLENKSVLVRYDNNSQIYNALATVNTSQLTAALSTGELFSGTPIDLKNSDTGDAGTQNKFLLNTEEGHIYIDAKRGQILLLRGNNVEELSSAKYLNSKYFTDNLPFQILKYFSDINIDNNYNGIGLHGVYDNFYKRLIITKLDYIPLVDNIKTDGTSFWTEVAGSSKTELIPGTFTCCPTGFTYRAFDNICLDLSDELPDTTPIKCPDTTITVQTDPIKTFISLNDPTYFCNKSWTMSFSFITNSWISWHSFLPNFYIPYEDYFQSGFNSDQNNGGACTIWDHNSTFNFFNTYNGVTYPYILEYPFVLKFKDEIVQSVKDYCTVLKYTDFNQFIEPNDLIYFNKAILSNNQQCSGELLLVPKSLNNLAEYYSYPRYNTTNTAILVAKSDHYYQFNAFWDKVKDQTQNIWLNNCTPGIGNISLNTSNIDYTNKVFRKYPLRAKDLKIKLIKDDANDHKLLSKFIINQTQNSYH